MNRESISDKEKICIMVFFILGTSTALVTAIEAEKDLWLAIILGIFMALFIVFIYAKLNHILPDKDLFDILEICFGKFLGKVIGLLYTWFAFHLGSIILRHHVEFFKTVSIKKTPILIPASILTILSVWIVKKGIKVISRFSALFLPIVVIFIFMVTLLLIPNMDMNNIHPILFNGIKPVIKGAFSIIAFPFGEIVLFTMIFSTFDENKNSFKIYAISIIIGGTILLGISLTNLLVLGVDDISILYFPTYKTMERINIGGFVERIEIVSTNIYIFSGFIKMSICLMVTCKGIGKIFDCRDYNTNIIPIALLMLNLSYILYDGLMDMVSWIAKVWIYYTFPFQVILPTIIWITAEMRKKKLTND